VFKGVLRDHIGAPTNMLNNTIFPGSASDAPIMPQLISASSRSVPGIAAAAPTREEAPIARYRKKQKVAHAT
jgi:hypothetical protein